MCRLSSQSRVAYRDLISQLGGFLLRDGNVSLSEDERLQRLEQFVDDVITVETQLAQVTLSGHDVTLKHWRSVVRNAGRRKESTGFQTEGNACFSCEATHRLTFTVHAFLQ